MRVDRDAAAVVAHLDRAVGEQLELDAVGVVMDRLVHRVVEHLGDQVMERALVGAADIHAGALADRLEAFEDLDVLGGIGGRRRVGGALEKISHGCEYGESVGSSQGTCCRQYC
jgi:hypothetical protein